MKPNKFIIEKQVSEFRRDNGFSLSEPITLKSLLLRLNILTVFIKVHRNTRNKGCNQNFHDIFYQVSKKVDYIAISDQDDIWFPEKIGTEENCPSISHISLYLLMYMEHITSSNLETRKVLNVFTTIFMKKHLQPTIPSYTK